MEVLKICEIYGPRNKSALRYPAFQNSKFWSVFLAACELTRNSLYRILFYKLFLLFHHSLSLVMYIAIFITICVCWIRTYSDFLYQRNLLLMLNSTGLKFKNKPYTPFKCNPHNYFLIYIILHVRMLASFTHWVGKSIVCDIDSNYSADFQYILLSNWCHTSKGFPGIHILYSTKFWWGNFDVFDTF